MSKETRHKLDYRKKKVDYHPKNFGPRLRAAIEKRGTIEDAVAKLGVSRATVFNWMKRETPPPGVENIDSLRKYLGDDADWILDGSLKVQEPQVEYNQQVTGLRYVSVVSWAHAGEATAYDQLPVDQQERVASTCTDPRAIAVTVEGDSMLPDFKQGDRVILAPSREPRNGRPVVAKLADDGIVLRIFHRLNGNMVRLSSLRPEIYPSFDYTPEQIRWIWPVEELSRKI